MTSINKEEVHQPLIEMERKDNAFPYTAEQLANLFDHDERKDLHEEVEVSQALYTLQRTFGGAEQIAKKLGSDAEIGICDETQAQIEERTRAFGSNKKKPVKIRTLGELIWECFDDFILQILIVAAIFQLAAGMYGQIVQGHKNGWMEGTAILVAIVIIVAVTSSQNYAKEKQFQALVAKQDEATAIVIRDGNRTTINAEQLQVGDVVVLESGKAAPADMVLLTSNEVVANESTMTGEPDDLHKSHVTEQNFLTNPNFCLLQTTMVLNGEGKALVLAVGQNTRAGMADSTLNIEKDLTPLQEKLDTIANEIGKVGLYAALATMFVLLVRMVISATQADEADKWDASMYITETLDAIIIAVTVIVVAVPEGLPLAVTIALAVSVMKMFDEHNLVRKLEASETMGGANEICTDKTGTLTQNNMTVKGIYAEGNVNDLSQGGFNLQSSNSIREIVESVVFNVSAGFVYDRDAGVERLDGNVTECGMLKYLVEAGVDVKAELAAKEGKEEWKIPFNSSRKRATAAFRRDDGSVRVFCKGAPEIVIEYCSNYHTAEGLVELDQDKKASITGEEVVKRFASKCWRTMLVSYRDFSSDEWAAIKAENNDFASEADRATVEENLNMACVFGLMDPLRPGIVSAVEQCHRSGINIRMCTGDNIDTATAISLECGIITQQDIDNDDKEDPILCMTGKVFRERIGGIVTTKKGEGEDALEEKHVGNRKEFRKLMPHLKVLARSSPEDKFMLVTGLMDEDCVVAVTGDGTNDVPALNKANVGFAMGIAGTDPAKNAADIVLTNDDFSSILVAVLYGRNIYDNVRKFLQFQLTVNVVAMFIVFSGAVIFAEAPLTAVQMLWVNMIMDTFAALALATEPPSNTLYDRKPQDKKEFIVNPVMWRNLLGQALYQICILLAILFVGPTQEWYCYQQEVSPGVYTCYDGEFQQEPFYWTKDLHEKYPSITLEEGDGTPRLTLFTIVFNSFVWMQIFNQFNARKLGEREFNIFSDFCNNWYFLLMTIFEIVAQWFIVEYGGQFVQCAPLDLNSQLICIGIGAFSLVWGIILKFVPARWFNRLSISEKPMTEEEADKSLLGSLNRSQTLRNKKKDELASSQRSKTGN